MRAMKSAKAMLLVLSKDFNDSPHTLNEVEAFGLGRIIIPLKMEQFEFNDDFAYFLRRVQSINGYPDIDVALSNLIIQLKEILPVANQFIDINSNLGVTTDRAKELEEQIKRERTPIQGATQVLPNEISQTTVRPDDTHIQSDATKEIAAWPDAGIAFLKNFKDRFDPTGLPFKPVEISSDQELLENLEIDWSIDDTYYFAVFLTSKRSDKVDLRWGYYSSFEKRDPLFRKRSDAFCENKIWLNDNKDVVIDGDIYYFNSEEGYLGFETSQRKTISSLSDPVLVEVIANKMKVFSQSVWPIIVKNRE
jgi:hypothetical protein